MCTMMAFLKQVKEHGELFFLFVGAMSWFMLAWSLVDLDFWFGGAVNPVHYNYIATWEVHTLLYGIGGVGIIMMLIGGIRVLGLLQQPPGGGYIE